MQDNRLLLLGCSRRKRTAAGLMPALERYDGPAFRVVRKAQKHGVLIPTTLVLSAEFGLIPAQQPIPVYNRSMSPQRAKDLAGGIEDLLQQHLAGACAKDEIFVCMGKSYLPALSTVLKEVKVPLIYAAGSIGRKISLLKLWLSPSDPIRSLPCRDAGHPTFRGRKVEYSAGEVLHLARSEASKDPVGARQYTSWYVPVDRRQVAPKWLVSQLTGVPVAEFRTDDALRLLTSLSVEVRRT